MKKQDIITILQSRIQDFSLETALFQEKIAAKAGFSINDMRALSLIMKQSGMSATELSKKLGITNGAVTGIVDRLDRKQLIYKQVSEHDARKILIFANYNQIKSGSSDYQRIGQAHEELLASYTAEELKVILEYIERAHDMTLRQKALLDV